MLRDETKPRIPCLRCDSKEHTIEEKTFDVKIKGKHHKITTEVYICKKCGDDVGSISQMDEFLKKYREIEKNG